MKTKNTQPTQSGVEPKITSTDEGTVSGINVIVDINSVADDAWYTFTGMTVNNTLYYELPIFTERYDKSTSTIRRYIDALIPEQRPNYCLSVSKKQYVNEGILLTGKKSLSGWDLISQAKETTVQKTRVGICGEIDSHVASQLKEDEIVPITGVTTNFGVQYIELEAFAKKYGIPVSALRKDLKEIFSKNRWSRERFRYVLTIDGKHFISPAILLFNDKKNYRSKLKNAEYATFFRQWEWDVTGTLRFNRSASEQKAVWFMKRLFKELQKLYPDTPAYFAYVTEKDPDGLGFHNHFVYGNRDKATAEVLTKQINKIVAPFGGRYDYQTHVVDMDQSKGYLEYIVKELHERKDSYGIEFC